MSKSVRYLHRVFLILVVLLIAPLAMAASNSTIVYQGRITRPGGASLNSGLVTFTLSIYSPSPSRCLLYSETQVVNMTGSSGMFSLPLGAGTRTDSGSHSFSKIFVNGSALSGLSCASGTSYMAGATDDRDLVVSFNDAGTVVNLSSMAIKSIPFALQAHEIDGWGLNNIVKVSSIGSATTFTTSEMANVKSVGAAACATNEILKWNGSAWMCSADATGGAPGDAGYTGSKGLVAFDTDAATSGITVSSGIAKLSNTGVSAATYGTASKVPSLAINAQGRITSASEIAIQIPSIQITQSGASSGDVLKWNGSAWLPAADNTGTSPGDATYAAKGLVQADTNATTSGLNLSSGVISVNTGTGVNQIVKLDASAKLPVVDGSQLTNLSAAQIASGTLPVSKGGTGSGTALTNNKVMVSSGGAIVEGNGFGSTKASNTFVTRDASGNFAAGTGTFDSFKLNGSSSGTLTLTVPASFSNFSLNLPSADGSSGQFLMTDGSGNLTWGTSAAPGDASYSTKGIFKADTDAATSGLSFSSSGVLKVNVGTGANQIVQLDSSSKLPAVDGSQITNLSLSQITAGTLPISRGGTGATTKTAAFDALSPNSTKGDITVFNGTNNVSLPLGSNGQVLTADSAQASGVKWTSAASGTVTSVTAGTGLTGGTITSVGTLSVNVGTGANQIVQLDASSKLPAVDGSLLTNLSASQISAGTLPVSKGGTGASSFSANQLVGTNGSGTVLQSVTCSQNQIISFDASGNYGCYNLSTIAGGTYFANGGNTFAANATLGTNDNYTLSLKTNNSNRMILDASGNVGIGTSSPGAKLHVSGGNILVDNNKTFSAYDNSGTGTVGGYFSMTTGNNLQVFNTTSAGNNQYIVNNNAGSHIFIAGAGAGTERLRIDSSGNVGIGTASPSYRLHVPWISGDATATAYFGSTNSSNNQKAILAESYNNSAIQATVTDPTGSYSAIYGINSNGGNGVLGWSNSGIGVLGTSYSGMSGFFQANIASNVNPTLVTKQIGAGTGDLFQAQNSSGTALFKITSAGDVGIGQASPGYKFDVAGSGLVANTHYDLARFGEVSTGKGMTIGYIANSGGTAISGSYLATTNGDSYLGTNSNHTALTVQATTGNVGIGTTNPSYALQVSRASSSSALQVYSGTNDANIWSSGYRGVMTLQSSAGGADAKIKTIMSDAGSLKFGKTDDAWSTETTHMTILDSGNVGIGTTGPSALLHVGSGTVAAGSTVAKFQSATGTCSVTPNTGMSCASDERLKQNFKDVTGDEALEKLLSLQAVTYEMKSEPGKKQTGFIAQKVQKVIPELVRQDEGTGLFEVFYTGFVPWITESIKALNAKIMGQERDIAAVMAENAQLKKDNEAIKAYLCGKDPTAPICK